MATMMHSRGRNRRPGKLPRNPRWNAHHHFDRQWKARNKEYVHVFANGTVYDKAARRKGLRSLVGVMRKEKAGYFD